MARRRRFQEGLTITVTLKEQKMSSSKAYTIGDVTRQVLDALSQRGNFRGPDGNGNYTPLFPFQDVNDTVSEEVTKW